MGAGGQRADGRQGNPRALPVLVLPVSHGSARLGLGGEAARGTRPLPSDARPAAGQPPFRPHGDGRPQHGRAHFEPPSPHGRQAFVEAVHGHTARSTRAFARDEAARRADRAIPAAPRNCARGFLRHSAPRQRSGGESVRRVFLAPHQAALQLAATRLDQHPPGGPRGHARTLRRTGQQHRVPPRPLAVARIDPQAADEKIRALPLDHRRPGQG